jgi:3-phenylpropionate/trans-cinnamate dioxygenase ferredoxin reductase component
MDKIVIVGGGAAGVAAAETLRQEGYVGRLALLCAETELPYHRPPLSKQVLTGAWDSGRTRLHEASHYADLGIRLVPGQASDLDTAARTVLLQDGYQLGYDHLVIATGVRPRLLPAGHDLSGVHVLRSARDATALRDAFAASASVVIVGAGFLGMEVAAAAVTRGLRVTVVEPLDQPMIRQVGPLVGAAVARLHREHGVDVRTGTLVTGLAGAGSGTTRGRVTGVVLSNGSVIPAECVVIAIGSVPATEWLHGSGLTVGNGVQCDEFCRAAPGVYAAGDVASWIHPGYRRRLRIEHWMHAAEQGTAAARNLLRDAKKGSGDPQPFAPVPYFWTDQYKVKIQVHGDPDLAGCTAIVVDGSVDEGRFVALYRKDGIVTAVLGWNAAARVGGYRKLLADQRTAGSPHPG